MSDGQLTDRPASAALDEYLVIECQLGNVDAFRALFHRWHGKLLGRARDITGDREGALDVTQEAWIGIVHGLHRLRDPAAFGAWALRILANKARDWVRRERSRRAVVKRIAEDPLPPAEPDEPPDDLRRVRVALAELAPDKRALLRRHYLEGQSVREIASHLGIPPGTVKSRLFNARNDLRRRLEED